MNLGATFFVIVLSLLSASVQAATVDEIIDKIDYNQSLGLEYMLTVEEIEQLEQSSNPSAHFYLGLVYAEGNTPNTARDQCKAAEHLITAASSGDPFAHYYLAYTAINGIGVKRSISSAKTLIVLGKRILEAAHGPRHSRIRAPYIFARETNMIGRADECLNYLQTLWPTGQLVTNLPELEISRPCIMENSASDAIPEFAANVANQKLKKLLERFRTNIFAKQWCKPPRATYITYGEMERSVERQFD